MGKSLTSLFFFSIDHFRSLKDVMKCFEERRNFDFFESSSLEYHKAVLYSFEHKMRFTVEFNEIGKKFHIELDIDLFGKSPFVNEFNLFKNIYVRQNFLEIVFVWARLNLRYKRKTSCERVLDDYILYKEKIKNYVKIIEMGSRFRKQCLMHNMPMEVRKNIYDAILKTSIRQLLRCNAYAKKLFP